MICDWLQKWPQVFTVPCIFAFCNVTLQPLTWKGEVFLPHFANLGLDMWFALANRMLQNWFCAISGSRPQGTVHSLALALTFLLFGDNKPKLTYWRMTTMSSRAKSYRLRPSRTNQTPPTWHLTKNKWVSPSEISQPWSKLTELLSWLLASWEKQKQNCCIKLLRFVVVCNFGSRKLTYV